MTADRPQEAVSAGSELEVLAGFLDWQRATALAKAEGLDAEQLAARPTVSTLTMGGLLKHLALVEDFWFSVVLEGNPWHPVFRDVDWDADSDWEFNSAGQDTPDWLRSFYRETIDNSRAALGRVESLDQISTGTHQRLGQVSVRWILNHVLAEISRHNGHADIIRESIDGATGW